MNKMVLPFYTTLAQAGIASANRSIADRSDYTLSKKRNSIPIKERRRLNKLKKLSKKSKRRNR